MTPIEETLRATRAQRLDSLPDSAHISGTEACVLLGVHRKTLERWLKAGLLPAVRFGDRGHPRFHMGTLRSLKG